MCALYCVFVVLDREEQQALEIRHEAAIRLLKHGHFEDPWDALEMVVAPTIDVHRASLKVARAHLEASGGFKIVFRDSDLGVPSETIVRRQRRWLVE